MEHLPIAEEIFALCILTIEARIEHINPLPPGTVWPVGLPEPDIQKVELIAFCPRAEWPSSLRKCTLEIEYPDSRGNWVRRISAPFEFNGVRSVDAAPLIWDSSTRLRRYRSVFSWHKDANLIRILLNIHFEGPDMPVLQQKMTITPTPKSTVYHFSFKPENNKKNEQDQN
jgi:hypothetical protein